MSGLDNYVTVPAFIIKKFRCEGINKGANSGFRITFLFDEDEGKFIFVEIYMKIELPRLVEVMVFLHNLDKILQT